MKKALTLGVVSFLAVSCGDSKKLKNDDPTSSTPVGVATLGLVQK